MTTIRRINVSQIDGNDANSTDTNEIRPFGETAFYLDTNGQSDVPVLMMFDGIRTHRESKVLSPGVLFGSNKNRDVGGFDNIKLVPDSTLYAEGSDQYLIVDPTTPNHIHIRAGGTQDNSSAQLFIGGENSYLSVGSGSNPSIYISASSNVWQFNTDGSVTFPDSTVQTTAWGGGRIVSVPISSLGTTGNKQGDLAFDNSYIYYCTQNFEATTYNVVHALSEGTADGVNNGYLVANTYQLPEVDWKIYYNGEVRFINQVNSSGIPGYYVVFVDAELVIPGQATFAWGPASITNIWKRVAWGNDAW